jgi:hypothetical protein
MTKFKFIPVHQKTKANLSRYGHTGDKGEDSNSSYSLLTSTLGGVSGQRQAPAAICPEKEPQYPLVNLTSELVCTQRG